MRNIIAVITQRKFIKICFFILCKKFITLTKMGAFIFRTQDANYFNIDVVYTHLYEKC